MPELKTQHTRYAGLPGRAVRLAMREPATALLAARMAAWVVALSLLVRLMPLPRALGLVAPRRSGRRTPRSSKNWRDGGDAALERERLARLLDSILAADLWVFTPTCWKRAAVLHRYLALCGVETRIRFGLRREGGPAAAAGHAWLEAFGEPLLETTPPDYTITYSFPN